MSRSDGFYAIASGSLANTCIRTVCGVSACRPLSTALCSDTARLIAPFTVSNISNCRSIRTGNTLIGDLTVIGAYARLSVYW